MAYTQGTDIYVAPHQERHVPHEAWHVVQQMQGRVRPTMQMKGVDVNDELELEEEADEMGHRAIQGKFADEVVQLKRVNGACVQRVKDWRDFARNVGISIGSLNAEIKEGMVTVDKNGNTIITDEGNTSAKECALIAIATKAAEIGKKSQEKFGDNDKLRVSISANYYTNSGKKVHLTLRYYFGKEDINNNKGFLESDGYIDRIIKTKHGNSIDTYKADIINNGVHINQVNAYSNAHEINDTTNGEYDDDKNIFKNTYKDKGNSSSSNSQRTLRSTNYDAYTKLAGEGARFNCVRNNMGKLTNNTVFYAPGQRQGIRFCDLWQTWSYTFHKEYNIPDCTIINYLKSNYKGKARNTLWMKERKLSKATNVEGEDIIELSYRNN